MKLGSTFSVCLLHVQVFFTCIQTAAIAPTEFILQENSHLVLWNNRHLNSSSTPITAQTLSSCLSLCLSNQNCVSFGTQQFIEQNTVTCVLHLQSDSPSGCSSDDTHLLDYSCTVCDYEFEATRQHYKLRDRCYGTFPSTPAMRVSNRTGIISGTSAQSPEDCSVLCQLNKDCAVAEYNVLENNKCNLFPAHDTSTSTCNVLQAAADFSVVPMPCVPPTIMPEYSRVTRGYFGTNFFSNTTYYQYTDYNACRLQCDTETECVGFAFDFSSYMPGRCRVYTRFSLCNKPVNTVSIEPGQNWFTYVQMDACAVEPVSVMTTTRGPTLPPTSGPPVTFFGYDRYTGFEVRGGELKSTTGTAEQCRDSCNNIPNCRGFEYRSGRRCYHFSPVSVCLTPFANPSVVHYRKTSTSCTWDYTNKLVRGGSLDTARSAQACELHCRLKYGCRAFDFDTLRAQCWLHTGTNTCKLKENADRVNHHRLKGLQCSGETEPIFYENTKSTGATNRGIRDSALSCFSECTSDPQCQGVDFDKNSRTCWFHAQSTVCNALVTDTCCDHLRTDYACALIDRVRPRQAIVTVQTPVEWETDQADKDCSTSNTIRVICQVIATVSTDQPRLRFLGAAPIEKKLSVKFETVTTSQTQAEQLMSRVNDILSIDMLKEHKGWVTFRDLPPEIAVTGMTPTVGPKSGGTAVTITGYNLHVVKNVTFGTYGDVQCVMSVTTPVLILCQTGLQDETTLLDVDINVFLKTEGGLSTDTNATFRYLADPVIWSVNPLETIASGGIYLTVSGTNLHVVQHPIMNTTVENLTDGSKQSFLTDCIIDSPQKMRCPTPSLKQSEGQRRKRHLFRSGRSRRDTLNRLENKQFTIGFNLDGVTEYRVLTGPLAMYSKITVYQDPVIEAFEGEGNTLLFVSTWPISDRVIEIKGMRLTQGLQSDDITVKVGESRCSAQDLFDNRLVCEPPVRRPEVKPEDKPTNNNKIPVKVSIGNLLFNIGYMDYQQTLWEYPPGRYAIIGGVGGLVFLILVIVVLVLCCRNSSGSSSSGGHRPRRQRSSRRSYEDSWQKPKSYERPRGHSTNKRHSGHSSDDHRHSGHSGHSGYSDDRRHSGRRPHSDDYNRNRDYNPPQYNRNMDHSHQRHSYDERYHGQDNETYMSYPESENTLNSQIDDIYGGNGPDLTRGLHHGYSMVKKANKAVKVVNAAGRVAEFFSD